MPQFLSIADVLQEPFGRNFPPPAETPLERELREAIAEAMRAAVATPVTRERRVQLATWARSEASLSAAASRAADAIEAALTK